MPAAGGGPQAVVGDGGQKRKGVLWTCLSVGVLAAVAAAGIFLAGGGDEGQGDEGEGQKSGQQGSGAGKPESAGQIEGSEGTGVRAASGTAVAEFDADTPYVNCFGMRFVPVAITGGPTDSAASGKTVLFSIWQTRRQDYLGFVKETRTEWRAQHWGQPAKVPVTQISWENAVAYCAWLTEKERKSEAIPEGAVYRLPSDHEWSCAVGIGKDEDPEASPSEKQHAVSIFPWGEEWPPPAGCG